jgi:hypothetical protein
MYATLICVINNFRSFQEPVVQNPIITMPQPLQNDAIRMPTEPVEHLPIELPQHVPIKIPERLPIELPKQLVDNAIELVSTF